MKLNYKDLRFLVYENRDLKFFYAINVHSESMNCTLFFFRDRMFPCQTWFFQFLGRKHGVNCISWFPTSTRDTPTQSTHSGHQPCSRTWFLLVLFFTYFTSCAWWEYVKSCSDTIQLAFVFILVHLLTAYIPYNSSLRSSVGLEKLCIQEACVQLITDQLHALGRQSGDRPIGLLLLILIPWANGNKVSGVLMH